MTPHTDLLSFQHIAPELRLFCGDDSFAQLAKELKRNGCQRAVVISGRSVGASHGMELLRTALGPSLAGEFNRVRPNSPVPSIEDATRLLADLKADACIAVGGGSAAVTARAASIVLAEGRAVHELCTRRLPGGEFESPRLNAAKLPQFVVPTTPSTAFVKAGSAVLDPDQGERLALFDPKTRAKAVFLHPEMLRSAPAELVLQAGLNTLSTAVEALESPKCDPISEAMLMQALRLVARHLHQTAGDDVAARQRLALAAVLCGRGTEQSGGGLATVLAHAIGHRSGVSNGIVNTIVLPHTMRFNAPATARGAARIVESLQPGLAADGLGAAENAADVLETLFGQLDVPRRLRDIGLVRDDLGHVADAAMSDWFIGRSARRVTDASQIVGILEAAW